MRRVPKSNQHRDQGRERISQEPVTEVRSSRTSSIIDQRIGARVRALRLARGMAQSELGRAIGVVGMQIEKYERGEDRIDATRMFEIARTFGVPVTAFLNGLSAELDL